jgi:hypothetical protein
MTPLFLALNLGPSRFRQVLATASTYFPGPGDQRVPVVHTHAIELAVPAVQYVDDAYAAAEALQTTVADAVGPAKVDHGAEHDALWDGSG